MCPGDLPNVLAGSFDETTDLDRAEAGSERGEYLSGLVVGDSGAGFSHFAEGGADGFLLVHPPIMPNILAKSIGQSC